MKRSTRNRRTAKSIQYRSLAKLLDEELSTEEYPDTAVRIESLKHVRSVGSLTRAELEAICRWKSPRAIRWVRMNSPARVKYKTGRAFATRSERDKICHLTSLQGVGIPMASAILMLTRPERYGVIDIRVWRLLHALGSVRKNSRGTGFTFNNWFNYLSIIRYHAKRLGVSARDVERTLFKYHKEIQVGPLYGKATMTRSS